MNPRIALLLLAAATARGGTVHTAPFGAGGTWNIYQVSDTHADWETARVRAEAAAAPAGGSGLRGHLVTFGSVAECQFVRHIAGGQDAWIGLTDNERFGGSESNGRQLSGWKWLTGEPLAFSRWKHLHPDNYLGNGLGEDAAFIERFGRWDDEGMGTAGENGKLKRYVIEWETRSAAPVKGAVPLRAVWPRTNVMPEPVRGKWSVRWASGYISTDGSNYQRPRDISAALNLLAAGQNDKALVQTRDGGTSRLPWLSFATADATRESWFTDTTFSAGNFPSLPDKANYIAAVTGVIEVREAGTYSFSVSAEEAFALRIGGLPWKDASGDGFIDPLDAATLTEPYAGCSTSTVGVIDLPAGKHRVEALWMVETMGSEFHVCSAPGAHLTEGSTDAWRPLGRPAAPEKLQRLGVGEDGWSVACTPGAGYRPADTTEARLALELDLDRAERNGLPVINFANEPAALASRFPDASLFPNDAGDAPNNHWPLLATARLVVPADGTYQIGIYAQGDATLRIRGGRFQGVTQIAQSNAVPAAGEDYFEFRGQADTNYKPKIVSLWRLEKGETTIEIFYQKPEGPATLAVFTAPAGPYAPSLLRAGGAGSAGDVSALPLAR